MRAQHVFPEGQVAGETRPWPIATPCHHTEEQDDGRIMIPLWLTILALASLLVGAICAAWIAWDVSRKPPHMKVMAVVWPLCALFGSIPLLLFYRRWGRTHGHDEDVPYAVSVAKGTLHCGAGCSLGDIIAETSALWAPAVLIPFGLGWLFSERIFAGWAYDFVWAFALGIIFQYFAIVPMRQLSMGEGLKAAVKADAASLTAWQVGMYGLMAIAQFWFFPHTFGTTPDAGTPVFWFAMQFAMIAGFVTAYPVNWWLISSGIKERM